MRNFWHIKTDFTKARSTRIGASDVPKIIPNPEKPTESLAGYEQTALTVWQEKTGRKERDPAGFPAKMGHRLEPSGLEAAVSELVCHEAGLAVYITAQKLDLYLLQKIEPRPEDYVTEWNGHKFYHLTQYYNDQFIAHPDLIWIPPKDWSHGPAIIEGKSATHYSAKRREGSLVSGYDFDLSSWQGIPLKHYMQVQFQLALFEIPLAFLSLIYDTSKHQIWRIEENRDHQGHIIDIAGRLARYIENDVEPRDMVMNQADVKALYPVVNDDFTMLSGEKLDKALEYARAGKEANAQIKKWKAKEADAKDALGVMLCDMGELRTSDKAIARWAGKKNPEKTMGLNDIMKKEKEEGHKRFSRYLRKNGLINPAGEDSRWVNICWKE